MVFFIPCTVTHPGLIKLGRKKKAVFGVVNIELVHGDNHIGIGGATQFLIAFLEDSCSSNGELKLASGDPVAI